MKNRAIGLGILGLVMSISFISILLSLNTTHITHIMALKIIFTISFISSFVLGIVTLAENKEPVKGLGVAMGVCGIVIPYANVILAIITVININKKSDDKTFINE